MHALVLLARLRKVVALGLLRSRSYTVGTQPGRAAAGCTCRWYEHSQDMSSFDVSALNSISAINSAKHFTNSDLIIRDGYRGNAAQRVGVADGGVHGDWRQR